MRRTRGKTWNNGNLDLSPKKRRVTMRHEEPFDPACAPTRVGGGVAEALDLPSLLQRPELEAQICTTRDEGQRFHAFLALTEDDRGLVAGKLELELDGMVARLQLTLTALTEQGNALLDEGLDERMRSALQRLGRSLQSPSAAAATGPSPSSVTATHQVDVQGDPDACFALACPVAELDWIDGWCFDLIYSDSGRNEPDNIFCEPMSGLGVLRSPGAKTYWYTTLYDAETRRFQAVLLTPGLTITRFTYEMDDLGDGRTRLRWQLSSSGLSDDGRRIVAEPGFEQRMLGMMDLLARSAKHYVETGAIYRLPASRRARVAISVIAAAVGRHVRRTWRRGRASGVAPTPGA